MKVSRLQLRQMSEAFSYLATLDVMPKFAVNLYKNQNALKEEVLSLQMAEKRIGKHPKWVEFNNKRTAILKQFGAKNMDGVLQTVNGLVSFPSANHAQHATNAVEALQREYPEEWELELSFGKDLKELQDEEVEVSFLPLKNDDIKSPVILERLQSVMHLLE